MERDVLKGLETEKGRRSLARLIEPLAGLRRLSQDLLGPFKIGDAEYTMPRFAFDGPNSSDPIRIGIFAAIHGDEPAGAMAAVKFLLDLAENPGLAENFRLRVYPVCNPSGFEDNTRCSRRGCGLNRAFLRGSRAAERLLPVDGLPQSHITRIIHLHPHPPTT